MKLLDDVSTIVILGVIAIVGYFIYEVTQCDSFFQLITTGHCSKSGATGTPGSGFPGLPGSTMPGQVTGEDTSQNACGFLDWVQGACINLEGGSCSPSDYISGNCSAPSPSSASSVFGL